MARPQTPREDQNKVPPLTEQVTAPDTAIDPEKEDLKEQLEMATKALAQSQANLAKATQPVVVAPPQPLARLPRNMQVERTGGGSSPVTVRWPQIRGGTCEFCGVLDPNVPAQYQYKLCPHFRGMAARCSYCPETKDPDEVVYHAMMNVAEHPDKPGTVVMWCNSTNCSDAHIKRFQRALN